ncbi:MAG: hypothetical protein KZQ75_08065 [Candidatus Thiodiazotropha sp. (ex Myrtea spinifera)]|nr:hypothetical protein [Candidatus Thiodiazotropha sp. (ex Myrtea spinifera)]
MTDLTKMEAYLAMYSFLEHEYEMTKSDDIGGLLGGMSLLQDGDAVDPAVIKDWEDAINKAKTGRVNATLKIKK